MPAWYKRILFLLIAAAMVTGIWAAYQRSSAESMHRQVEIALDSRLLWRDDFGSGKPGAEQLHQLQAAGCTAVAINPLSLAELEKRGQVTLLDTAALRQLQALDGLKRPGRALADLPPGLFVSTGEQEMYERLHRGLYPLLGDELCLPGGSTAVLPVGFPANRTLFIPEQYAPVFRELPLYMPQEQMTAWNNAGFKIIPLFNLPARFPQAMGEKYWEALAVQLQELPEGERADLGPIAFPAAAFSYPLPQGKAAEIFHAEGFALGTVEFTQGAGLNGLAKALNHRVLRAHQIPSGELGQLGEARAIERYVRAVQERNTRLLLLYPFPELDPRGNFNAYRGFVDKLGNNLKKAGFSAGGVSLPTPVGVPAVFQSLFSAGTVAAALLLVTLLLFRTGAMPGRTTKGRAGLAGGKSGNEGALNILQQFVPANKGESGHEGTLNIDKWGAGQADDEPGHKETLTPRAQRRRERLAMQKKKLFLGAGIALILGVLAWPLLCGGSWQNWWSFPSSGYLQKGTALAASLVFPVLGVILFLVPPLRQNGKKENGFLWGTIKGFLWTTLFTVGGALVAAGMLGETAYLLKIDYFQGVKISQIGPFVLLGLFLLQQKGQNTKQDPVKEVKSLLEMQIKVKHLLFILLGGGALLLYLIRGGNFPVLPVSQWELAFRRYLEVLLVARPRFKEFLIGHPGFFLFAALAPARIRGAHTLALLLALLGQVSIFNTFMHLHRPVGLSLLGTVYGAALGIIIGLILYQAVRSVILRKKRPDQGLQC